MKSKVTAQTGELLRRRVRDVRHRLLQLKIVCSSILEAAVEKQLFRLWHFENAVILGVGACSGRFTLSLVKKREFPAKTGKVGRCTTNRYNNYVLISVVLTMVQMVRSYQAPTKRGPP